jgi:hypothetical protein
LTGTVINVVAILVGGALGLIFVARLPERTRATVVAGLGLFTMVIGVTMAIKMEQPLVVLGSLLVGGILGEWWRLEDRLRGLGGWLEKKFVSNTASDERIGKEIHSDQSNRFIHGFLTASLVFGIGPMAILGSIQDGLTGDYNLLAIKSVLDGFASLAFASSLGVGVLFSSLVILVYQGGISLLAAQAQNIISAGMMNEMTAVGGILLLGIGISSLLELKPIRVGNFLPALAIAPLLIAMIEKFSWIFSK